MKRRKYIISASAGSFAVSGCLGSTDSQPNDVGDETTTGRQLEREVEWDGELEIWFGSSGDYIAFITGQIYNVGDASPIDVEFESALLDQDENRIDSRERVVRGLVEGTRQQYFFRYYLTEEEAERVDDFRVEGEFRD